MGTLKGAAGTAHHTLLALALDWAGTRSDRFPEMNVIAAKCAEY